MSRAKTKAGRQLAAPAMRGGISLLRFGILRRSRHRVDLRRYNKVIPVKPSYRVRPERHRHLAPFGQNRGMMVFRFSEIANPIRKAQGFCKIAAF
jgi:hypothetical protein